MLIRRHFDQIDQKWRRCHLCGQRYHPENELVKYEGVWYCVDHYHWRFDNQAIDDVKISNFEDGEE